MDFADALVAVLILLGSIVPIAALATTLRRRYYADLDGATALLASIVLGLSIATVAYELIGIFGLLARPALVLIGAASAAVTVGFHRAPVAAITAAAERESTAAPSYSRWGTVVALLLATAVVAQWSARTVTAVKTGISDFDSLVYHLPHAVRIAQTGATGRAMFVMGDARQAFHSLGSETLQAVGMIATQRTVLVPWFNLGWLLIALLGGWCLLRRAGASAVGLIVVSLGFALPLMVAAGAGTAKSDTAATALLVVATALLLANERRPGGLLLAGLAAGLALGAKENMLGPVLGLAIVVAFMTPARRVRALLQFIAGTGITGGFWLVRNLVHSGNPFPSAHLPLLPSPRFPIGETFDHRLSEYLTNGHLWRTVFLPGLGDAVGRGAVLIALLTVAALGLALWRGGRIGRGLTLAGAAAAAFFVITPFTAPGLAGLPSRPLYVANTRYGIGALFLCLFAGAVTVTALGRRAAAVATALAGACVVLTLTTGAPLAAWAGGHRKLGAAVGVAVLVAVVVATRPAVRRAAATAPPVVMVAAGVALFVGGAGMLANYADRYPGGPAPSHAPRPNLAAFGRQVAPARIRLVGVEVSYPLVGNKLENTVRFIGVTQPHGGIRDARSCAELRRRVDAGHFDFVIVGRYQSDEDQTAPPPAASWLRGAPDLTVIAERGTTTVFAVNRGADAARRSSAAARC